MSTKSLVSYVFDPSNPAPLTPEQNAEIEALTRQADAETDTSDIPPLGEEFWQKAVRNPFHRPVLRLVQTVRKER